MRFSTSVPPYCNGVKVASDASCWETYHGTRRQHPRNLPTLQIELRSE